MSPWKKRTTRNKRPQTGAVFYEQHGEGPKGKFCARVYLGGSVWLAAVEIRDFQGHLCGTTLAINCETLEEAQQQGTRLLVQRCQKGCKHVIQGSD